MSRTVAANFRPPFGYRSDCRRQGAKRVPDQGAVARMNHQIANRIYDIAIEHISASVRTALEVSDSLAFWERKVLSAIIKVQHAIRLE